MKHSIISNVIEIGTEKGIKYAFERMFLPYTCKQIIRVKCFAVAQKRVKPFSIYPVEFMLESNDLRECSPLHIVAVPHPDVKVSNEEIHIDETYIVSCDESLDIPCIGGEIIMCYARPLFPHKVAPKAFCIIEFKA